MLLKHVNWIIFPSANKSLWSHVKCIEWKINNWKDYSFTLLAMLFVTYLKKIMEPQRYSRESKDSLEPCLGSNARDNKQKWTKMGLSTIGAFSAGKQHTSVLWMIQGYLSFSLSSAIKIRLARDKNKSKLDIFRKQTTECNKTKKDTVMTWLPDLSGIQMIEMITGIKTFKLLRP